MNYFSFFVLLLMGTIACQNNHTPSEGTISDSTAHTNSEQEPVYTIPGLNHGLIQSPVNILSFKEDDEWSKHNITVNFKDEINKIENTGHSIQLDFKEGSTITMDGLTYDFIQCHFHTPSEHLIDGMTYPMEMHFVNTLQGQKPEDTTMYLVVGILFKMGKENQFINEFINLVPKKAHDEKSLQKGAVNIIDLFKDAPLRGKEGYYFYQGSLTTPPYTESVKWCVSKHIYEASPEQIERINKIEGNNARHVQALYGRKIDEY